MSESSKIAYSNEDVAFNRRRASPRFLARFPVFFLLGSISCAVAVQSSGAGITKGHERKPFTDIQAPGDYVWKPEISPSGPVVVVVSLEAQKLYVYRNGVRIGRSTISSGKAGFPTPTGVFTILQKNAWHSSNLYQGALMPYMERLTWGGVALHAGNLPGYPAAHGCVRLPLDFARQLYTVTNTGTTVVITDRESTPFSSKEPGLIFTVSPGAAVPPGIAIWMPDRSPRGPVSIIMSSADSTVYVYRNGIEIGQAAILGLSGFMGSFVYSALANVDATGRHEWQSTVSVGGRAPNIKKLIKRIGIDEQFLAEVRALVTPGTTLILTDSAVNEKTRSGTGFGILIAKATPLRDRPD